MSWLQISTLLDLFQFMHIGCVWIDVLCDLNFHCCQTCYFLQRYLINEPNKYSDHVFIRALHLGFVSVDNLGV